MTEIIQHEEAVSYSNRHPNTMVYVYVSMWNKIRWSIHMPDICKEMLCRVLNGKEVSGE